MFLSKKLIFGQRFYKINTFGYNINVKQKNTSIPVIEYTDELKDDFSEQKPCKSWRGLYTYYRRDPFYQLCRFFWCRLIGTPVAWTHAKLRFRWRVVNRQVFRQARDSSYFIYGNHTQNFFDASMCKIIAPKDAYVIVNERNIMMPGIGWLARRLGALPIIPDLANTKRFIQAIDQIVADKKPILIYPEAHIWPYYTGIRPFVANSFRYPVKYQVPAFCFTNTYHQRGNKVQIITYVDGPFYPNPELDHQAQIQDLRDRVYAQMVKRSQASTYQKIIYRKKEAK